MSIDISSNSNDCCHQFYDIILALNDSSDCLSARNLIIILIVHFLIYLAFLKSLTDCQHSTIDYFLYPFQVHNILFVFFFFKTVYQIFNLFTCL